VLQRPKVTAAASYQFLFRLSRISLLLGGAACITAGLRVPMQLLDPAVLGVGRLPQKRAMPERSSSSLLSLLFAFTHLTPTVFLYCCPIGQPSPWNCTNRSAFARERLRRENFARLDGCHPPLPKTSAIKELPSPLQTSGSSSVAFAPSFRLLTLLMEGAR